MNNIPLKKALEEYIKEENIPFSMPGHKQGKGFIIEEQKINLQELFLKADLTEVDGLDNLHKPEGAIREGETLLSNLYGSHKSYFLVNGSTSGNLIMIFATFNEGDKVIVERNCHKSIFNGIILRKLNPIYIRNIIDKNFNAPLYIDEEDLINKLDENPDVRGIILTYPNYYGVSLNLENIIKECKKRKVKVLIDCAHGAHFGIHPLLPENPVKLGADMVVMSAHKTLPSLTQTAFLHINDEKDIEKAELYKSMFLSTSPSYMFLLSMDYARAYLEKEGFKGYDNLIKLCNEFKESSKSIDYISVWEEDKLSLKNASLDKSRIVINLKYGLKGSNLLKYLRDNGVQAEMCDDSNVVFIPSTFNSEEDFKGLLKVLKSYDYKGLETGDIANTSKGHHIPQRRFKPHEVINLNKTKVSIDDSLGRVSGENIIPYPPGIPIVMMGEIIDIYSLNLIKHYLDLQISVLGVDNKEILVIEEENI